MCTGGAKKNARARSRTGGSKMATWNFTAKPLALLVRTGRNIFQPDTVYQDLPKICPPLCNVFVSLIFFSNSSIIYPLIKGPVVTLSNIHSNQIIPYSLMLTFVSALNTTAQLFVHSVLCAWPYHSSLKIFLQQNFTRE